MEIAGKVALTHIQTCHAGSLLSQIYAMSLTRNRAALGPRALAGLLLGGFGCNNLLLRRSYLKRCLQHLRWWRRSNISSMAARCLRCGWTYNYFKNGYGHLRYRFLRRVS